MTFDSGERIKVKVPCECGEVAVQDMTIENARKYATILLSMCDNLEPVEIPVAGGDSNPP